jgi:hypothetical protein
MSLNGGRMSPKSPTNTTKPTHHNGYSDFPEVFDHTKGEKSLWRAVITQALMDAGSNSTKREMRLIQAQAISWLSGMSPDFKEVCDLADYSPEHVRKKAREAIDRNCEWRKYNANSYMGKRGDKLGRGKLRRKLIRRVTPEPVEETKAPALQMAQTW